MNIEPGNSTGPASGFGKVLKFGTAASKHGKIASCQRGLILVYIQTLIAIAFYIRNIIPLKYYPWKPSTLMNWLYGWI